MHIFAVGVILLNASTVLQVCLTIHAWFGVSAAPSDMRPLAHHLKRNWSHKCKRDSGIKRRKDIPTTVRALFSFSAISLLSTSSLYEIGNSIPRAQDPMKNGRCLLGAQSELSMRPDFQFGSVPFRMNCHPTPFGQGHVSYRHRNCVATAAVSSPQSFGDSPCMKDC